MTTNSCEVQALFSGHSAGTLYISPVGHLGPVFSDALKSRCSGKSAPLLLTKDAFCRDPVLLRLSCFEWIQRSRRPQLSTHLGAPLSHVLRRRECEKVSLLPRELQRAR